MNKAEQTKKVEELKGAVDLFLAPLPEGSEEKQIKATEKKQKLLKLAYSGLSKSIGADIFDDNLIIVEKSLKWKYGDKSIAASRTEVEKADMLCGEGKSEAFYTQLEIFAPTQELIDGVSDFLKSKGYIPMSKDYHFHIAADKSAVVASDGKIVIDRAKLKA